MMFPMPFCRFFALIGLAAGVAAAAQNAPSSGLSLPSTPPALNLPSAPPSLPQTPPAPSSPGTSLPQPTPPSTGGTQLRYWSNPDPNAQVTITENTLFRVRTSQPISTKDTRDGAQLAFMLSEDVVVDGTIIVPRGATLRGVAVRSRTAGGLNGAPELVMQLTGLDLGGRSYVVYTSQFKVTGISKTKSTEKKVATGAAVGALAGLILGAASGKSGLGTLARVGVGAAAGAGAGAAVSALSPGTPLDLPTESEIDFQLASPMSVIPATAQEAMRLSQGLHSGGAALYVRGQTQ